MSKDLHGLFSPKSVCVIGASRSTEKVGGIILKNIIDSKFAGKIYPINPNTQTIFDLPCFPDLENLPAGRQGGEAGLPEIPELAIVAVPAGLVLDELEQIGKKGIKNVVILTSGFKEAGIDGEKIEKDLIDISKKYDFNLLGPNCMGFVNNALPINATFGQSANQASGNLRFITQSGAIASSIFDWCNKTGVGFAEFVTLGNKAVLNENDVLEYFYSNFQKTDSASHPIGLYLESISDGPEFLRITSELSKTHPIFIIKAGKTKEAAKAIHSHTGSIAGEDSVIEAAFSQTNVIRCQTLESFFDISRSLAWGNVPAGPKVAIVSNAGGPAVICADAVVNEGLTLSEFDDATKDQLKSVLPHFASVLNPVDISGDALADRYAAAAEIILKTDQVDALVVILTPQVMTQIEKTAELIGDLKKYGKPIFCAFMGGSLIDQGEKKLNELKIPSFPFPERAISAIGIMWQWKKCQQEQIVQSTEAPVLEINNDTAKTIIENAKKNNEKALDNFEANEILKSFGIPTPATEIATDLNQAKNFAEMHSWPVVLKLSSPGLLHKKDIGGVVTDISNNWQLEIVWDNYKRKITTLEPDVRDHVKLQIQKEILNGIEVIIGIKRDPIFGPVLLFGAGGSYAELIEDRNLHLLPVNLEQAKKLVDKSKIAKILKGYRGQPPYALDKLYDCIVRLSKIIEHNPDIAEIEINPLIVTLNNVWAVDGKVILLEGIRKVIPAPAFQVATTISHEILAGKFHHLVFEAEKPLIHKPGQYVSVKVSNQRINCYSIATDEGANKFGLLIDTKPGGVGSKFFENIKTGDKITYLGPFGTFNFNPNDDAKQIIFLATGSGIAPLRCIIDDLIKNNSFEKPLNFYFGLRFTTDIFWHEYLQKLSEEHPNIKYKLTLSQPDESWHGLTGHVTDAVKADFQDVSNCAAYLCGNKHMIEEATEVLLAAGCPKERIYSEKF